MPSEHHLTDEELLRTIDRELPLRQHRSAADHLARCGDCRERQTRLDAAANCFTALHHQASAPGEDSGDLRHRLSSRLHDAGREHQLSAADFLHGLLSTPRWIAIGVAAAVAMLVIRVGVPGVTADSRTPIVPVAYGSLPIASLTPGATWNVSLAELCAAGTREQRQIPEAVRQKVVREYAMTAVPADTYELDYLITPELGGAPDARNLWPQRYAAGVWNARVKDDLERLLPRLVCNGRVNLEAAQRDIARDWIAAYRKYFNTDAPLQRWARLSSSDEADEPEGITYPVWRSASAPQLELISFSVRR